MKLTCPRSPKMRTKRHSSPSFSMSPANACIILDSSSIRWFFVSGFYPSTIAALSFIARFKSSRAIWSQRVPPTKNRINGRFNDNITFTVVSKFIVSIELPD